MARFFISYRRGDAAAEAGRLFDLLAERFGADAIFIDVDTLRPGVDYRRILDRHLRESRALLAVIGRGWLDARDAEGRRRLDAPDDFVRYEIETAVSRGVPVIPVLVDGAGMPPEAALPQGLKRLAHLQAVALDTPEFRRDAEPLVATLGALGGATPWWRRLRWRAAAVMFATALLVALLATVRVGRASVDIELRLSRVTFTLAAEQPVLSGLSVTRLGVAGLDAVTLPAAPPAPYSAVLLEGASPDSTISLPPLVLPAGASVSYARGAVPGELHVELKAPSVDFQASAEGPVRIGIPGVPPSLVTYDVPERVRFTASSTVVDLTAVPAAGAGAELLRQVRVTSLAFASVEEAAAGDDPTMRAVSAIESGRLVFGGRGFELKAGDWLRLESMEGVISTIRFDGEAFSLRFAGSVGDVHRGPPGDRTSAMPSYLEAMVSGSRPVMLLAGGLYLLLATVIVAGRRAFPA